MNFHLVHVLAPQTGFVGFLAGVTACRVVLRTRSSENTQEIALGALSDRIGAACQNRGIKWVVIDGDEGARDHDLLMQLRMLWSLRVYVETRGARSTVDRNGKLPLYDHVCLTPVLPVKIAANLFHSALLEPETEPWLARDFDRELDKAWEVETRYVAVRKPEQLKKAETLVRFLGGNWTLTAPLLKGVNRDNPVDGEAC